MAKAPVLGRVKTRLARDIGAVGACRFYRTSLAMTLRRLGADPRWSLTLALAPDGARIALPSTRPRTIPQGRGDLGRRMQRILDRARPGPVIVVGGDIPQLRADHVARALRLLGRADVVLGPAEDGGYWLVGARRLRRTPLMFRSVRWSSRHALDDTRANLAGLRVALADTLADIDDGTDYARAGAASLRLIAPPRRGDARRVAA
jgi:rSAM/selenodomain-associated transferase 1